MSNFRSGDRVRYDNPDADSGHLRALHGTCGTVTAGTGFFSVVQWDNGTTDTHTNEFLVFISNSPQDAPVDNEVYVESEGFLDFLDHLTDLIKEAKKYNVKVSATYEG